MSEVGERAKLSGARRVGFAFPCFWREVRDAWSTERAVGLGRGRRGYFDSLRKVACCCLLRITMETSSTVPLYSVTRDWKQCFSVCLWVPGNSERCLGTLGLGRNPGCCWLVMGRGRGCG